MVIKKGKTAFVSSKSFEQAKKKAKGVGTFFKSKVISIKRKRK